MVAYSFKPSFWPPIRDRSKRQTIRNPRDRHARPGERVQLYGLMRQPGCFKIIPDPVCIGIDVIEFDLRETTEAPVLLVNGIPLAGDAAEAYAWADGFRPIERLSSYQVMCRWWVVTHGRQVFHGFAIRWEDRS